jgi:glycosyltransferase involved in cell wall biosynthesis
MSAIRWADVVHYHFGGAFALPREIDIACSRLLRKIRLITFWGTDIRVSQTEAEDNPYFDRIWKTTAKFQSGTRRRSDEIQKYYAEYGFSCVLGSEMMIPHLNRDLFPSYHLVRCGVDIKSLQPVLPEAERKRAVIVHSPSDPAVKGTAAVLKAVEILKARKLEFDFILIENTSREGTLETMSRADIVLDQFILGGYGMAAIEAMALGKAVVCYIKPSLLHAYPADLPIANANPDTLVEILEPLIVSADLRRSMGASCRQYAEKYHDSVTAARQLMKLYQTLATRGRT